MNQTSHMKYCEVQEIRQQVLKKKTLQKAPFQPIPVTGWWFSNDEPISSQAEKPWFVFMEQVGSNSTVQKGHKTYLIVGEQAHGTPRLARIVMDQVIRRSWMNPETIRKLYPYPLKWL